MKKISTLFVLACSLVIGPKAAAQISQSFDTQTDVATLAFNCWSFNNVAFSDVTPLTGSGNLLALESTSSTIATPMLEIPANNLIISFDYKVVAAPNGNNTIKVILEDLAGVQTLLETISFNKAGNTVSYYGTFPIDKPNQAKNINGTKRIILEVVNSVVQIDNLQTNAPLSTVPCVAQSPMPVKLVNFQGAVYNNKGRLSWTVAENETGDYFKLLRSADGKTFAEAATVFMSDKTGAESYTFTDAAELSAITYYKLKIVNKDNSIAYSNTIALRTTTATAGTLTLLQNPVASTLNFSYTAPAATQSNVAIYTTGGVKVYSSRINSAKGYNTVSLPLDHHLAPGTYILEVWTGADRLVSKLIKQ